MALSELGAYICLTEEESSDWTLTVVLIQRVGEHEDWPVIVLQLKLLYESRSVGILYTYM